MPTPSWHERVFRALLRIFPADFRGDFGDDMTADFRDQRDEAARTGRRASMLRIWLRALLDVLRRAPAEHADVLLRDAKYARRVLRRRPAFAAVVVLTIAAGVGLNAAVFSVVNGVLLRNLPVKDADRLVRLHEQGPAPDLELEPVASANFLDWAAQTRTLDALALVGASTITLLGTGDPEQILAMRVSSDFFKIFPTTPVLGRLFIDADALVPVAGASGSAAPRAMLVGHELWQRRLGGRLDVIGTTVRVFRNGRDETVEIIGVLERGFAGHDIPQEGRAEAWMLDVPAPLGRRARMSSALGRLAPGVPLESARAEFDVIASQLAAAYPKALGGRGVRLVPLLDSIVGDVRHQLWFLFGAAFSVLLIGCANLVNLLLAHESSRRLDLATRVALGASPMRLLRQTVTLSTVIAASGGAAGLVMAYLVVPALVAAAPPRIPRLDEVALDASVVAFTIAVSLLVGIGCGLAAYLSLGRLTGPARLAGADAGSSGGRVRHAVAVAQIAIALMLVVAAGLMVRTFRAVSALELGFDPSQVLAVGLSPNSKWDDRKNELESAIVERVAALPGVVAAGIGSRPLGGGGIGTSLELPGRKLEDPFMSVDPVTPGFLEALGARLAEGRFFSSADTARSHGVAVLNEAAVRVLWPQGSALGQVVLFNGRRVEVVGVLADVRRGALEMAPKPTVYVPSSQAPDFWVNNLLIRTTGDPMALVPALRAAMRTIDRDQALVRINTLEETLDAAKAPRRFMMQLAGIFSILALGLAALGVYGVTAGSIVERVPEIGVRITCGATTLDVVSLVARHAATMVVPGIVLGLAGAVAISGAVSGLVFGVEPTDPATYVVACASLTAAAVAACTVPARRAATIDPAAALREG